MIRVYTFRYTPAMLISRGFGVPTYGLLLGPSRNKKTAPSELAWHILRHRSKILSNCMTSETHGHHQFSSFLSVVRKESRREASDLRNKL